MAEKHPQATHPKNHTPFLSGVKGGFSCANCEFLRPNHHCSNEYYQKWNNGSSKLPDGDLREMCSDWFSERKGRKSLGEAVREQREKK